MSEFSQRPEYDEIDMEAEKLDDGLRTNAKNRMQVFGMAAIAVRHMTHTAPDVEIPATLIGDLERLCDISGEEMARYGDGVQADQMQMFLALFNRSLNSEWEEV